jgi:hypothetical protein
MAHSAITVTLAESLKALHEASADEVLWKTLHQSCDLKIQAFTIPRTKETRDAIASLNNSIKSIARCLNALKARNEVPDTRKLSQRRAAELIDDVQPSVDKLGDCLEFQGDDDDFLARFAEADEIMKTLADDLKGAIEFQIHSIQGTKPRNMKVDRYIKYLKGNRTSGPTGTENQRGRTTGSVFNTSSALCNKRAIVIDGIPTLSTGEQPYVHKSAQCLSNTHNLPRTTKHLSARVRFFEDREAQKTSHLGLGRLCIGVGLRGYPR